MRHAILILLVAGSFFVAANAAQAQNIYPYLPPQYGPGYQTPLSPYLNFLRGGDPAANYFLGVVPEFQRRTNAAQFRSQIQGLQILTAPLRTPPIEGPEADLPRGFIPSGHPAAFGYTGTFFGGQQVAAPRPAAGSRGQYTPFSR
jgi:hypothetical protein